MLWADPSPTPTPITVSIPPDTALDNYTMALANYTRDLAVGTAILALFTIVLAIIGITALLLQRREIRHTAEQLTLAKEQFKLAREQTDTAKGQLLLARDQFELTSKVAAQQLKQAEATAAMAHEMQRERELAARPYLAVELLNTPYMDHLMIHNVGRGPALNCVWTHLGVETGWRRSKVFHVAPGAARELRSADISISQPGEPILTPLWDYGQLNEVGAHEVINVHSMFCLDETGTMIYRFIDGRPGYDIWRLGDPEPPWVTFFLQAFAGFRSLMGADYPGI